MKAFLKMLWPFGLRYERRMLNRDARYIVEDATERFNDERRTQMANAARQHLNEALSQLDKPHLDMENVLLHFQTLHRNARRERQDMGLSALTLVIIYLRAQRHGDGCTHAVSSIHEFIDTHASPEEDDQSTGHVGRMEA